MFGSHELPEPVLEKPAKVGGRVFPIGSKVAAVLESAQRHYSYWKEPRNLLPHPIVFDASQINQLDALLPNPERRFVALSDYLQVLALKEQAEMELESRVVPEVVRVSLQDRMWTWVLAVLGLKSAHSHRERNTRFLEEAAELVQAAGMSEEEAIQTIQWVFARPKGEVPQEIAGVMTTLLALATSHGVEAMDEAEKELKRIWTKRDQIAEKQKTKIRFEAHTTD